MSILSQHLRKFLRNRCKPLIYFFRSCVDSSPPTTKLLILVAPVPYTLTLSHIFNNFISLSFNFFHLFAPRYIFFIFFKSSTFSLLAFLKGDRKVVFGS